MNKAVIRNFAVWARQKLISDITYKAGMLGITDNGIAEKLPQSTNDLHFYDIGTKNYSEVTGIEIKQRDALVKAIKTRERSFKNYKEAFDNVVEEVAYTWFNRLIAIRFMEVNDYLPSGVRVLSSENKAKNEPDFVTSPFDTDLVFTPYEQDRIIQFKEENKLDELFRMLFIKQCNKLSEILPELFEKTDDFSELLLTISFTDKDGIVYHLTHDIEENDFNIEKEGQVEIIGWLFQYYNIALKAKADDFVKNGGKITKHNLPEKTQVFTPDWIVRYMVENSIGQLWLEGHDNYTLTDEWKYYINQATQENSVVDKLNERKNFCKTIKPEDIKVIDPCMGSGHILVYAFDVLMQIYTAQGYTQREAAKLIIENNLYGLDIDKRAYQLAYFALMMKARQYNRRIFNGEIKPNLFAINDSSSLSKEIIDFISDGNNAIRSDLSSLALELLKAKECGSVLDITAIDFASIYERIEAIRNTFYEDLLGQLNQRIVLEEILPLIKQAETMAQKYAVVITNPPYLGLRSIGDVTLSYIQENYPDSKNDFFAVFIEKATRMAHKWGRVALVTAESWLSLSSFEKIRCKLLNTTTINCMAHLGENAFDAGFGTVAFCLTNSKIANYMGTYHRLTDLELSTDKETAITSADKKYIYIAKQDNFHNIEGSPVSYWVSNTLFDCFQKHIPLGSIAEPRQGLTTCDNNRFMRFWHEVTLPSLNFNCKSTEETQQGTYKWFPYNKGGEPRKWYGNNEYVVNWQYDGKEIKEFVASKYVSYSRTVKNIPYYFQKGLTWSAIAKRYAVRAYDEGFIFADKGQAIFADEEKYYYLCGLLNSKYTDEILKIISPTLDFNCGYIKKIPIIQVDSIKNQVENVVKENISLSKSDWDAFETSWDFRKHPLVPTPREWQEQLNSQFAGTRAEAFSKLSWHYKQWEYHCNYRFEKLKENEEELNRIFINIYGLQDELTSDVAEKDVTVRKADLQRDIKSLLSYAVGCMFGRYSLDYEGIAYAGGDWNSSKYESFIPDKDNCIPITDEEYFEDDIVGLLCAWLKKVYGEKMLEENLTFIANALGNKGSTSREVIRNYFLNDFIKDHIKVYQKRPIYWMFDSGKQNGFKALCYMHRWNADTIGNMRVEYLHRMQRVYDKEIERMQEVIDNSRDNKEISAASKRKEKLQKQIKETKDYDALVAHLALSRIDIDLDDGVKVNYDKVQTAPDGKKMQILAKI